MSPAHAITSSNNLVTGNQTSAQVDVRSASWGIRCQVDVCGIGRCAPINVARASHSDNDLCRGVAKSVWECYLAGAYNLSIYSFVGRSPSDTAEMIRLVDIMRAARAVADASYAKDGIVLEDVVIAPARIHRLPIIRARVVYNVLPNEIT